MTMQPGDPGDAAAADAAFAAEVDRINLDRLRRVSGWSALICLVQLAVNTLVPALRAPALGALELAGAAIFGGLAWRLRQPRPIRHPLLPVGIAAVTTAVSAIVVFLTVLGRLGPNVAFAVGIFCLALVLVWRGPWLPGCVLAAHALCTALLLGGPYPANFKQVSVIGNSFAVLFAFVSSWMLARARRAEFNALRLISRQNEALAALNREKDELMAVVAHDLRGPLGSVAQLADMIPRREAALSGAAQSALAEIRRAALRMCDLVTELVEVHQIEGGAADADPHGGDLCAAAREAVAFHGPQAAAKQQTLLLLAPTPEGAPVRVRAGAASLARILGNLVSNALKFTPSGGRIEVGLTVRGAEAELRVSDTGPGIRPEDVPNLFRKFGRLGHRTTGGEASSGLGLYATRRLVEHAGGRLLHEPRPGGGSVFLVLLPLADGRG